MNRGEKNLDEIIREIASEENLKIPYVEHIIDSQFRFINDSINNYEGKIISMIYIGKFRPNGIKEAKDKGLYKKGKFIRTDKINTGELLDASNIQDQNNQTKTSSTEETKDM